MNILSDKKRNQKILLAVTSLFLFYVFINYLFMPWLVYAEEVKVPKVVGKNQAEAIALLEEAGLNPMIGDTTYDNKYPKGSIVLQKPYAGSAVKRGRMIYLVACGGEPRVTVPTLKGKSVSDARFSLERVGLRLGVIDMVPSQAPKDVVIEQQFLAGTSIRRGLSVNVSVSSGETEGTIEVPDLTGKSLSEAEQILSGLQLKAGNISYVPSFDLLPNTVRDQDPIHGKKLNPGDAVNLFVTRFVETKDEVKQQ